MFRRHHHQPVLTARLAGSFPGNRPAGSSGHEDAYDALTTVSAALRLLPTTKPVQRSQVNTVISGFTSREQSVPGAGGLITFDNSGNRTGTLPPVIRLCPMASGTHGAPVRTTAALARPGATPQCSR